MTDADADLPIDWQLTLRDTELHAEAAHPGEVMGWEEVPCPCDGSFMLVCSICREHLGLVVKDPEHLCEHASKYITNLPAVTNGKGKHEP